MNNRLRKFLSFASFQKGRQSKSIHQFGFAYLKHPFVLVDDNDFRITCLCFEYKLYFGPFIFSGTIPLKLDDLT